MKQVNPKRWLPPLLALAATACGHGPAAPLPVLPLPEPPTLPTIPAGEVKCLSDATWRKIVGRDALLRHHAAELRAILQATQPDPQARPP